MSSLRPWFALKSVPGVGSLLFRRLVEQFGSPEAVFTTDVTVLQEVQGVTSRLAAAIRRYRIPDWIDRELEAVRQKGYTIVTQTDPTYPPLLRQIPDPPPFLYVYGSLPATGLNIAVVGSRNATDYGISTTRQICMDLVRQRDGQGGGYRGPFRSHRRRRVYGLRFRNRSESNLSERK